MYYQVYDINTHEYNSCVHTDDKPERRLGNRLVSAAADNHWATE